jgi:hypothetical protein
MKILISGALVVFLFLQSGWLRTAQAQVETDEVVGQIVRYDEISNTGTANGDMIVRLKKSGKFIRLLYSPHDFAFDAPPPKADQVLPREMFADGKINWKFHIHPPRNSGENLRCASFPKKGVRDSEGRLEQVEAYTPVPGNELVVVPQSDSLPCQIVVGWERN